MPYKSQAQAGYFHTHKAELEKQGVDVGEWDRATKGKKLPKKIGKSEPKYDGSECRCEHTHVMRPLEGRE